MPHNWLLTVGPAISLLLELSALMPGASWPIDIATRGLDGDDPKTSAVFALAIGAVLALTVSIVGFLVSVLSNQPQGVYGPLVAWITVLVLFVVVLTLARLFSLEAEQFDQAIWWKQSPKGVTQALTLAVSIAILVVALVNPAGVLASTSDPPSCRSSESSTSARLVARGDARSACSHGSTSGIALWSRANAGRTIRKRAFSIGGIQFDAHHRIRPLPRSGAAARRNTRRNQNRKWSSRKLSNLGILLRPPRSSA
jgi:lysylphosphatidylglycerol synthetase-like protein (DUF2156 family)